MIYDYIITGYADKRDWRFLWLRRREVKYIASKDGVTLDDLTGDVLVLRTIDPDLRVYVRSADAA